MTASNSRNNAGRALMTHPAQSRTFETARGISDPMGCPLHRVTGDRSVGVQFPLRKARQLHDRPDLDGALAGAGDAGGDADGLVEVARLDEEEAAELFAGFRERAVGHQPLAVA